MNPRKHYNLKIISIYKIWDLAAHNALTDLIYFQDKWFCTFRESDKHAFGRDGAIRLIVSDDLGEWTSVALFTEDGVDLRDPKLCETPDGRLMLLAGGTICSSRGTYVVCQSRAAFSQDGFHWTPLTKILEPHEWLWRVTWHEGQAYGVSYRYSDPDKVKSEWEVNLFKSNDGLDYKLVTSWNVPGYPNEATLRFTEDGEMIALLRRDEPSRNHAWIGKSMPPYTEWNWHVAKHYFGGPNFLILDDESCWAAGRICTQSPYGLIEKTALAAIERNELIPLMVLPSGGDTSYPGMVYQDDYLWISYYSSHEGKASIYLACIDVGS